MKGTHKRGRDITSGSKGPWLPLYAKIGCRIAATREKGFHTGVSRRQNDILMPFNEPREALKRQGPPKCIHEHRG